MRNIPLIAVGAVFTSAFAGDDDPVKMPYVEQGDCWSYRAENLTLRGPIDEYDLCVTHVDPAKNVIFAAGKVKSDGREIDTSYSRDWGTRVSVNGNIYSEGLNPYKFPLRVGDTYATETKYRRALYGENAGTIKLEMRVVGWEDVTVPAGKFRAMKIEGRGAIYRSDIPGVRASLSIDIWYVPEVNRHVKLQNDSPGGRSSEELTAYKLNK